MTSPVADGHPMVAAVLVTVATSAPAGRGQYQRAAVDVHGVTYALHGRPTGLARRRSDDRTR